MEETKNYQSFNSDTSISPTGYWQAIKKRKKSVIALFLLPIIIAVVLSFLLPKNYETQVIIKPPKINEKTIEMPKETAEFFDGLSSLYEIAEFLKIPKESVSGLRNQFKAEEANDLIIVRGFGTSPEDVNKITEAVKSVLFSRYQKFGLVLKKEIISSIEKEISPSQEKINFLNDEINISQKKIEDINPKIESLNDKISYYEKTNTANDNSALFSVYYQERRSLIQEKEALGKDIRYKQQDIFYTIDFLEGRNILAKDFLFTSEGGLKSLEEEIKQKKSDLEFLKAKEIENEIVAEFPAKPIEKKSNIPIAGALGIFLGISWAFSKEWWDKFKK